MVMSNWMHNGRELTVSTAPSKTGDGIQKHPRSMALADLGKQPTASDVYESWIIGFNDGVLVHRGKEYAIGKDISDDAANMVLLAQWIGGDDARLDFAHKLLVAWLEHARIRSAELSLGGDNAGAGVN